MRRRKTSFLTLTDWSKILLGTLEEVQILKDPDAKKMNLVCFMHD